MLYILGTRLLYIYEGYQNTQCLCNHGCNSMENATEKCGALKDTKIIKYIQKQISLLARSPFMRWLWLHQFGETETTFRGGTNIGMTSKVLTDHP